eukprot:3321485-Rhodomonas_salina.1
MRSTPALLPSAPHPAPANTQRSSEAAAAQSNSIPARTRKHLNRKARRQVQPESQLVSGVDAGANSRGQKRDRRGETCASVRAARQSCCCSKHAARFARHATRRLAMRCSRASAPSPRVSKHAASASRSSAATIWSVSSASEYLLAASACRSAPNSSLPSPFSSSTPSRPALLSPGSARAFARHARLSTQASLSVEHATAT